MDDQNPFPDGPQKRFLRRLHLKRLSEHKHRIGRDLAYFGLPSAEMLDIKVWLPVLGHITAVERDPDLARIMYRTAQRLGVRQKTIIIERDLLEATDLLTLEGEHANNSIARLLPVEQSNFQIARSTAYDVVNLDLCGGFLYPDDEDESKNVKILDNIIKHQENHRNAFIFIITFYLRDKGGEHYNGFIESTLDSLGTRDAQIGGLKDFYLVEKESREQDPRLRQPPTLRKLRFCVPIYLHKIAFDSFQVKSLGAWYYKKLYHTALLFEPRKTRSVLGKWPPIDEVRELLNTTMLRIEEGDGEDPDLFDLPAPVLPSSDT